MQTTLTLDGDSALIEAFIAGGLRASNAINAAPLTAATLKEKTMAIVAGGYAGGGILKLGKARAPGTPRQIIRGSPAVRAAAIKRLAAGTATPACHKTPAVQQLPPEGA